MVKEINKNMLEEDTLKGKTIEKVIMSPNDLLTFHTDSGPVSFRVEGDCCSSSYFYEITGIDKILGKKIEEIVELPDIDVKDAPPECECVQAYAFRLSAAPSLTEVAGEELETSNSAFVVFRNESNGYYGGYMEPAEYSQQENEEVITSDWHRPAEKI